MASVGHAMIGMAVGRLWCTKERSRWSPVTAMAIGAGLSLLPDLDALGFAMGVKYAAPWGHRGATHSLAFAAGVAVLVGLGAKAAGCSARWAALLAWGVVASHGLLDALTDGGLGSALLWPFSQKRYFAPWRPLAVAPIGRGLLSAAGLRVARSELLVFSPFLLYALWPRKRETATLADRR